MILEHPRGSNVIVSSLKVEEGSRRRIRGLERMQVPLEAGKGEEMGPPLQLQQEHGPAHTLI